MEGLQEVINAFDFFGSLPYFYFRFRLYGRFCLIFARTAQQLVLDGTNGLSSSKPCAYSRIVRSGTSRGNLCDSTTFLFIQVYAYVVTWDSLKTASFILQVLTKFPNM